MRAERAEQRASRVAAAQANARSIEDEARRPIEEKEEVFDNNEDEGVGVSETMDNVDDDEDKEQKVDAEEEELLGTVVLARKSKLALNDTDLYTYFLNRLERMSCPNRSCGCLAIVDDSNARSAIAKYLSWFERQCKHDQDSIVFEWMRYVLILKTSIKQRKGMRNRLVFRLPFVDDGTDAFDDKVRTYLLCKRGLVILLNFGERRYVTIRSAAMSSSVLPDHKSIGTKNYNAVEKNERKYQPLLRHFEYLMNLGEVRATRVVATLVDGMGDHANRDRNIDVTYLPISMGYRSCYKRYMKSLGYDVRTTPLGGYVVTAEDEGMEVDPGAYVTFPTYLNLWKRDFKNLKVSRPAEDICKDCYMFANRHRHLAHHSTTMRRHDGDDVLLHSDSSSSGDDSGDDEDDDDVLANHGVGLTMNVDLKSAEAASNGADEERELMLLEAAEHVKMARAQRALYQAKVADAVADATEGKNHTVRRYTFVVDYGQNMELPVYNKEQPGITYYYSPLSVYNLGIVDHAHVYDDGRVTEHMHCHVYQEGVGKKGASNVASLIVNTLFALNLLREEEVGGELNIIFDNCSGQNKNNTVLKLAAWLMAMGYFKSVQFIFLVVGHTKNAADRLFNSLKHEYRKQNLFTFDQLVRALDHSETVTVYRTVANDFFDYDKLLDGIYRKLVGHIKQNHIFSCKDNGSEMTIRKSNLAEHQEFIIRIRKKNWETASKTEMLQYAEKVLKPIKCLGLNPYKMVEMFKNYRPVVPVEFHSDELYAEPSPEVWSKVKVEKVDRSEFRANLKAKKFAGKELIESKAFDDNEGIGGEEGRT